MLRDKQMAEMPEYQMFEKSISSAKRAGSPCPGRTIVLSSREFKYGIVIFLYIFLFPLGNLVIVLWPFTRESPVKTATGE